MSEPAPQPEEVLDVQFTPAELVQELGRRDLEILVLQKVVRQKTEIIQKQAEQLATQAAQLDRWVRGVANTPPAPTNGK